MEDNTKSFPIESGSWRVVSTKGTKSFSFVQTRFLNIGISLAAGISNVDLYVSMFPWHEE